jgi:murein DD-endopeptidase MepM/ murein hydrolase activator NlpD
LGALARLRYAACEPDVFRSGLSSKLGVRLRRFRAISWATLLAVAASCILYSYRVRFAAGERLAGEGVLAQQQAHRMQSDVVVFREQDIPPRVSFASLMEDAGLDGATAAKLIAAAHSVFDLRQLRAGNRLAIGRSVLGELRAVRYSIDPGRILWIAPRDNGFRAEIQAVPSVTEATGVGGQIRGSLFDGVTAADERPELAMRLADIFAYDLDFYTDPRPGDTFRLVVEKKRYGHSGVVEYGRILAAEYDNGGRVYRAILFHDAAGNAAYYTPEGKSMKREFLHSPLKFAATVTSHFSLHRFHPILKTYRPHLGTDYAAPSGTPVQTIGEGRVVFAGPKGGAGNLIEIQHANGYETYYMHLSRILVHDGQRVQQGQNIGLVGMTGLATGPHLDFRIERRGQFLNFERLPLPPTEPVAKSDLAEFQAVRDRAMGFMPQLTPSLAAAKTGDAHGADAASSNPPSTSSSVPSDR